MAKPQIILRKKKNSNTYLKIVKKISGIENFQNLHVTKKLLKT